MQETAGHFVSWLAAINKFIDLEESLNTELTKEVRSITGGFIALMIVVGLIAIAIAIFITIAVARSIVTQLGGEPDEVSHVVQQVARGNLCVKASTKYPNSLLAHTIAMKNKLAEISGNVQMAINSVENKTALLISNFSKVSGDIAEQSKITSKSSDIITSVVEGTNEMMKMTSETGVNSNEATKLSREGKEASVPRVEEDYELANNVATMLNNIYTTSSDSSQKANSAVKVAQAGEKAMKELNANVESIVETTKSTKENMDTSLEKIEEMKKEVRALSKVMEFFVCDIKA